MNKDDKLIEALINATEKKKVKWVWENWKSNNYIEETYTSKDLLIHYEDKETTLVLVKYGTLEEKVDFLIFDGRIGVSKPILIIEEKDIDSPHRLWTLYKLADRNANGTDKIIDTIISKYSDYNF